MAKILAGSDAAFVYICFLPCNVRSVYYLYNLACPTSKQGTMWVGGWYTVYSAGHFPSTGLTQPAALPGVLLITSILRIALSLKLVSLIFIRGTTRRN